MLQQGKSLHQLSPGLFWDLTVMYYLPLSNLILFSYNILQKDDLKYSNITKFMICVSSFLLFVKCRKSGYLQVVCWSFKRLWADHSALILLFYITVTLNGNCHSGFLSYVFFYSYIPAQNLFPSFNVRDYICDVLHWSDSGDWYRSENYL